jgi:hypothetical protein
MLSVKSRATCQCKIPRRTWKIYYKNRRDFFSMTRKISTNLCIGRVPLHQEKKNMEEQVQFESNDDFFLYPRDCSY